MNRGALLAARDLNTICLFPKHATRSNGLYRRDSQFLTHELTIDWNASSLMRPLAQELLNSSTPSSLSRLGSFQRFAHLSFATDGPCGSAEEPDCAQGA